MIKILDLIVLLMRSLLERTAQTRGLQPIPILVQEKLGR